MKKIALYIFMFSIGLNVSFANEVTIKDVNWWTIYQYSWEDNLTIAEVIEKAVFEENTSFKWADLEGVNFEQIDLKNTSFENANLRNANLENVNFENIKFNGINLEWANLTAADIKGDVSFENANLRNSNWTNVFLTKKTSFKNANTENAIAIKEAMEFDPAWANMSGEKTNTLDPLEETNDTQNNKSQVVPQVTQLPKTWAEHILLMILALFIWAFIFRKEVFAK